MEAARERPKQVLCVLPSAVDKQALSHCSNTEYIFHWFDDPKFWELRCDPKLGGQHFDVIEYVEKAVTYIKNHHIHAVFYSNDFAGLLAAVICQETGLRSPSVKSQFLCIHKYYSRKTEPSKLWCEAVDLDNQEEWCGPHIKYPCIVKPPFMDQSIGQFIINNESEIIPALSACKSECTPFFELLCPVFKRYIDVDNYPLILKNIAVVEELVEDGSIHCTEVWADENGKISVWLTTDNSYFCKPKKTVDAFVIPSQIPPTLQNHLESTIISTLSNFGITNTFFNVEFWYRENGKRIDIVELNNRICTNYYSLQQELYSTSSHYGALYLACGEMEKLKYAHQSVVNGLGQKAVSGMFLVSLFLKQEATANAIINFEELGLIRSGKMDGIISNSIMECDEESTIAVAANGIRCIGAVFALKNTLTELLDFGDEVRSRIVKDSSLLGWDREQEYLQNCQ